MFLCASNPIGRCFAYLAAALSLVGWTDTAAATDYFWTSPSGGAFQDTSLWQADPPSGTPGPGGSEDNIHFNLNATPSSRYTVTDVFGQNSRLLVHNDSLTLEINA